MAQRDYQFWNAIAATPEDFVLNAGTFGLTVAAGGFTSYQVQRRMPDGTTYAPVTAVVTVAGYTVLQLPSGRYRIVLVSTAFIGLIEKIDAGRV